MPVFQLTNELIFPPPAYADPNGLLAVGGDLSPERLLLAYENGIFPWYSKGEPILWWSPEPRFVLYPNELKISKSMKQVLRSNKFTVSYDQEFHAVISQCRQMPRKDQPGTWITAEMIQGYCELHKQGFAHSVEVWHEGELAGGLYGVSLGKCFFGESMFTRVSNASKTGFITLVRHLHVLGFDLIDCQVHTHHLQSFGARHIPREQFLSILFNSLQTPPIQGNWGEIFAK